MRWLFWRSKICVGSFFQRITRWKQIKSVCVSRAQHDCMHLSSASKVEQYQWRTKSDVYHFSSGLRKGVSSFQSSAIMCSTTRKPNSQDVQFGFFGLFVPLSRMADRRTHNRWVTMARRAFIQSWISESGRQKEMSQDRTLILICAFS